MDSFLKYMQSSSLAINHYLTPSILHPSYNRRPGTRRRKTTTTTTTTTAAPEYYDEYYYYDDEAYYDDAATGATDAQPNTVPGDAATSGPSPPGPNANPSRLSTLRFPLVRTNA
ncbi:hypothetical protein E2C01_086639 [Portunus trituberculatus]|uniref:Uncharacterized protein n=1 Tax=Portunus trituberculatus TaxID=210409 RepID=A0A5B7JAW5_PORTR|nr:hypothetical protein [Portunus trituberculatus]